MRDDLPRGDLAAVLEAFSAPFPGFSLYYHDTAVGPTATGATSEQSEPDSA